MQRISELVVSCKPSRKCGGFLQLTRDALIPTRAIQSFHQIISLEYNMGPAPCQSSFFSPGAKASCWCEVSFPQVRSRCSVHDNTHSRHVMMGGRRMLHVGAWQRFRGCATGCSCRCMTDVGACQRFRGCATDAHVGARRTRPNSLY